MITLLVKSTRLHNLSNWLTRFQLFTHFCKINNKLTFFCSFRHNKSYAMSVGHSETFETQPPPSYVREWPRSWPLCNEAWPHYLKGRILYGLSTSCFSTNKLHIFIHAHTLYQQACTKHPCIQNRDFLHKNISLFHEKKSVFHLSHITSTITYIFSQKRFQYLLPTHSIITHYFRPRESNYSNHCCTDTWEITLGALNIAILSSFVQSTVRLARSFPSYPSSSPIIHCDHEDCCWTSLEVVLIQP